MTTRPEATTENLVVGSGAGGAVTAALLAEAGQQVIVVEEGPHVQQGAMAPFSLEQMTRQYRNAGVTAALGYPPIAYAEGCCVGGSTEVNSGLYHRLPPEVLREWNREHGVQALTEEFLDPHYQQVERGLSVQRLPGAPPRSSRLLEEGARTLDWHVVEAPRWYRYDHGVPSKQSMTRTYLRRAVEAGAEIWPGRRVDRVLHSSRRATGATLGGTRRTGRRWIRAKQVWVCAGAVGTPALLQRSGLGAGVGASLRVHPTVKVAARFPFPVDAATDVPVHQVKEFAPDLSFGGSASRPGYVALALADSWRDNRADAEAWPNIAVYYAAIRSTGHGRVRALPAGREPLVTYHLTRRDLALLQSGLARLAHLLFAAGANVLYPGVRGAERVRSSADLPRLRGELTRARVNLMTVHLTSTVPLGEGPRSPVDSFGRLRHVSRVNVNDASLLPTAPGVNPQGAVMAIASRNVSHHLMSAK